MIFHQNTSFVLYILDEEVWSLCDHDSCLDLFDIGIWTAPFRWVN